MKDAQIGWIAARIIGGDGAHDEYRARCHRGGRSARRRIGRGDPEADAAAAWLSLSQINPHVLMMQSTKDGLRFDTATGCSRFRLCNCRHPIRTRRAGWYKQLKTWMTV